MVNIYVRCDETRQYPNSFAKLLGKHDICYQHTMVGTPQQNDVAERRNRSLIESVMCMLRISFLSISLWMYALKTIMYLQTKNL